jgi:hypothetical protein
MRTIARLAVLVLVGGLAVVAVPQAAGAISPTPSSVNFGNVALNTAKTVNIKITVDSGYEVSLASGAIGAPFSFAFDTCVGLFKGPGTCNVKETFTPTATGPASGTLAVFECPVASGTCITANIPVQGNGVSVMASSPPAVDFGNVALTTTRTANFSIAIDAGYHVVSASGALNPPFGFNFDTCGAGGGFNGPGTCNVKETFTPTVAGAASSTLNVSACPSSGPCITVNIPLQGTGVSSTHATNPPYWPGWDIARGVALTSFGDGGYVLDGYGGIHPYSNAGVPTPPAAHGGPYWSGWNIARGIALLPDNTGGYVLDGYGGLHPFGIGGHAAPPAAQHGAYWAGWDIARGVTFTPDGTGGYVVDGYGGLHPFTVGSHSMPAGTHGGAYWPGLNIARGITLTGGGGGYVLDAYGGLHGFATTGAIAGATHGGPYWPGFPIARGVDYDPIHHRGFVLDGYGGLHPFTGS